MQYFFWGPEFKPAYVMFREIFTRSDVKYVRFLFPSYILIKMYNALKSIRPLIIKYITNIKVDRQEPKVFVYYDPWDAFMIKSGCLSLLRRKYQNSIHVALLYDIKLAKRLDITQLKNAYDDVYIYDQEMAKEWGLSFLPPCYSKNFKKPSKSSEIYDISFVGHAKDRLSEIIRVYEKLVSIGLKCRFYIVGVESDTAKYKGEIVYGNRYLNEDEYFYSYIAPSKCLLEIADAGTEALTARVREAVMYDKKILSNNQNLKRYKYYNEDMMQVYENIEDIDIKFFDKPKQSYHYEGDFSPVLMLDRLKARYEEWSQIRNT